MCMNLILEIVDKVVTSKDESYGMKRKFEEFTVEAQTSIDEVALRISALKIQREYAEKIALGKALYKICQVHQKEK